MAQQQPPNQREVAWQFRHHCQNIEAQGIIMLDKDLMTGIPKFLLNHDKEVLKLTLQGLKFLSANPLNHEKLGGMTEVINNLMLLQREKEIEAPAIAGVCSSILDDLEGYLESEPGSVRAEGETYQKEGEQSEGEEGVPRKSRKPAGSARKRKTRTTYNLCLVIQNVMILSPDQDAKVVMACLKVKGVTSATISNFTQIILVTTKDPAKIQGQLISAIGALGFRVVSLNDSLSNSASTSSKSQSMVVPTYLTSRSESGRKPNRKPLSTMSNATTALPTYFDDNTTRENGQENNGYFSSDSSLEGHPNPMSMIHHQSYVDSTLEAQFTKKRQENIKKEQSQVEVKGFVSSWLSYISGY
eukprot:gb/GEZN01004751.1/.p1 GENE.gb/GEZN01004751.1/~~gb/GEZN01004751.1/.p1  ORF type:complete len:357 (-),score=59.50 gb/GEZN01004751.1/:768-1838(-)